MCCDAPSRVFRQSDEPDLAKISLPDLAQVATVSISLVIVILMAMFFLQPQPLQGADGSVV